MDISLIPATIYFVGIAAVVAAPPESNVSRAIIFPNAAEGSYGATPLMPHVATLNLRRADLPATPADYCERIGGSYDGATDPICSVTLNGARLWTRTTQALVEDTNFRRMPSFLNYNRNAKNLPSEYLGVDPKYVAARFEITGGTLSGCNRVEQYIVTLNTTSEFELFLDQNDRTTRIVLGSGAQVAIENKPLMSHTTMISAAGTEPTTMSHFGWYYAMNGRYLSTPTILGGNPPLDPIVAPQRVSGPRACDSVMPIDPGPLAAASAECSAINYP